MAILYLYSITSPLIMTLQFIIMLLSASILPLLALLALLLRRNLFKGPWKVFFLTIGLVLLCIVIIDTFHEHLEEISLADGIFGIIAAIITVFILAKFNHNHHHAQELEGAKGIVISEAFHSLIDGAVIGATYLVNPLLGYAATIGIITHELPKILGTLTVFRSLGLSVKKTLIYGVSAQIGSPVAALFVYMLGKQFDHEQLRGLEIASVSSLGVIILWIIYLEIKFHRDHGGHAH
jgi:zinc and cadmium transporter